MEDDRQTQPRLFVINLDRSPDRRRFMAERFDRLGMQHEFVAAVDGSALSQRDLAPYNREKRLKAFGCDLTPNEIGCYLSHYRLFEKIVDENIPRAMVFEDDVVVADDFPDVVRSLSEAPNDWEFIRLAGTRPRRGREVARLCGDYRVVRLLNTACGAQAYLVNLRGARKLLTYGREMTRQIDLTIDRYWENGLRIMAVQPYPVWSSDRFQSDIGADGDNVWRQPGMQLLRLRIKTAKMVDSINKRASNLRIYLE